MCRDNLPEFFGWESSSFFLDFADLPLSKGHWVLELLLVQFELLFDLEFLVSRRSCQVADRLEQISLGVCLVNAAFRLEWDIDHKTYFVTRS